MTARMFRWMVFLALAAAWGALPEFTVAVLDIIGLYALVALGIVLLTGIGGMTSFGQAAFVGLGAYATAVVCTSPAIAHAIGVDGASAWLPWIGLACGCAVTALVAWGLGAITLRLSGHYLPLGTIAWGLSLYFLFGNLDFLGGHTGLGGLPALNIAGLSLASPRALGVVIALVLFVAIGLLHNLLDSRTGRAIRALRGGRVMAESMGIDTAPLRIRVFIVAAMLACISGWLYAHLQRFVNPTPFSLGIGIELLFMAVVGGAGHLWGAVLGAAIITLMKQQLQDVLPRLLGANGNFETIVFGVLMLFVLQRFSEGLWPVIARRANRWFKPARAATLREVATLPSVELPLRGSVVIEARAVSKHFGGLVANDSIDLDVRAGEIHALIGPNGAGKSTFFNMISGVDDPTAGEVRVGAASMTGHVSREFAARGIGRTFQHVRLLGERSVLDNVALGAHRRGSCGWIRSMLRLDRREEAALQAEARAQLDRCGLAAYADAPAGSLALGQQRIVEIARALSGKPSVLLLDEPAAGLRHREKRALAELLSQLRGEGLALLIVEHDMDFVMTLADRVTVLEFGKVIARGTPREVQADPRVREAYLGLGTEAELAEPVAPRAIA